MSNSTKWTRLPTSNGNDPIQKFRAKLSEVDKDEIAKSCFGMGPLRLFWDRSKKFRSLHFPILDGIVPCNLLFLNACHSPKTGFQK